MSSLFVVNSGQKQPSINFDSIGTWSGRFIFAQKALLSYTAANGWKIAHLNLIQLFFRKVFGAYKSTHLDHVFTHLDSAIKSKDNINQKHHLASCYNKLFPKYHFRSLGNAQLDKAKVICFAERHDDEHFHKYEISVIQKLYNTDTDVILVEGCPCGPVANEVLLGNFGSSNTAVSQRLAPFRGYNVYGWEPEEGQSEQESISNRNQSLANQIKHFRALGKRVFVIAGFLHLVAFPQKNEQLQNLQRGVSGVQEVLKQNSFVTFYSRSVMQKVMKKYPAQP